MKKLMTHMVAGYPNYEESKQIFQTLIPYSQYIEIQFPFSDPIGDGPVIEQANRDSIKNGMTTEKCFNFIEDCYSPSWRSERGLGGGLLIMTYYNIVLNYGIENFVQKAKEVGVYGFILPDIPFDEGDGKHFRELCRENDMVCTELVTPSTPDSRLKEIANVQSGLIYAVSQNMTTGSQTKFGGEFDEYIKRLYSTLLSHERGKVPRNEGDRGIEIGVGFGVKTQDDVEKVCKHADFAIIGSEFIQQYQAGGIQALKNYLDEITM